MQYHAYIVIFMNVVCLCVCVCLVCMWAVKTLPAPGVHLACSSLPNSLYIEHPFLFGYVITQQ